ncbi:MAG: NfeD family protein [Opitutaceae bacterium]|nr:NfeD family protein [Opitutaceae bacterium]
MTVIILLFVTGALLLAAEIVLPGAIAGIMGGVALAAGAVMAFVDYGSGVGLLATLGAFLLLGLMLYVELVWLPRSRLGRSLVVQSAVDGVSQPPVAADSVVGSAATALTPLAPSGFVEIAGRRYEAFCRSGHAAAGTALTVVGLDNFRVIVSESKLP